jgi:hypothetical protein
MKPQGEFVIRDPQCPKCWAWNPVDAVRQYRIYPGIKDLGWRCRACEWEWGFEHSPASYKGHRVAQQELPFY